MKIDFIVMAAGNSRRFGKNKLLQEDCCFCPVEQKQELADADTEESRKEIVDYFCKT